MHKRNNETVRATEMKEKEKEGEIKLEKEQ